MARSRNKVELIGNLGNDPDIKYSANGNQVTRISVATTEKWKDSSGNPQERTEWHRVVFFGKLAEIAGEYLSKGTQVFIDGKLRYEKVTTDDGDRYYTDIIAEELNILGGGQNSNRGERNDSDYGDRDSGRNRGGGNRNNQGQSQRGGGNSSYRQNSSGGSRSGNNSRDNDRRSDNGRANDGERLERAYADDDIPF